MNRTDFVFAIAPDGKIELTVKGVKGPGCGKFVEEFGTLGQVTDRSRTGEFYENQARQGVFLSIRQDRED